MFLYEKKIAYLSLFEAEEKTGSAGFASLSLEKEKICVIIQIKDADRERNRSCPVFLLTESQRIAAGTVSIEAGRGNCERKFLLHEGRASVNHLKIEPDEICAVEITLSEGRTIEGCFGNAGKKCRKRPMLDEMPEEEDRIAEEEDRIPEKKDELPEERDGIAERKEELPEKKDEMPELKAVSVASDKWEQLKNQFKVMHPFGDEREFISIEVKDFTVLREAYQRLVNNSFLLHGFYNYRHLILGRDCGIGTKGETCFYLGVPGVFFEREKMVAVMFGFEGFESAGPVETGKFGYYLRRVEI